MGKKFTPKVVQPELAAPPVTKIDLKVRKWQFDAESEDWIFPLDDDGANILTVSMFEEKGAKGWAWALVTAVESESADTEGDESEGEFSPVAIPVEGADTLWPTAQAAMSAAISGFRSWLHAALSATGG